MLKHIAPVLIVFVLALPALAQPEGFKTGPLIEDYGPQSQIPGYTPIPEGTSFKISFDVTEVSKPGELNRTFVSAARFLNMHAAAGVPDENMQLAIVLHSKAIRDVTNAAHYAEFNGDVENANAALIAELQSHGVTFHVCGQSATVYDVATEDLLPGVEMSLSAMTSHALLQQQGYTLNPF